ncbi:glycosyltransferase family 39 protein [Caldilinea sp.]|jgi:4-amino-4-deoxy-L-arabinose transferase-like glycosyltransferase|uniref:glycosyltransferase family 39 protein n=1 Tax=Caldilinea sp. TaxID=2293560 RepID=UPI002623591D|nr:glycosyltransferase family 39 protein [uncultured Caldilinea sp.]
MKAQRAMRSGELHSSKNLLRLIALGALLLAFLLRAYRLDHQELRGDEAFGYFFVQRTYAGMIEATVALAEPHPVGSYFVLKPWLSLAGDGEFALRFPSVWFGVLAVALTLRLALRLGFRRATALLATLLLALSPYAAWHSQDARMYSMSMALTVAAVWLGVETLQRQRSRWGLAYVAVAWLALHTHYYAAFALAALTFFVATRALFVPNARSSLARWLMWQTIVAALYLPWLLSVAGIIGSYGGNGDSPDFWSMAQRSLSVFAVGETAPAEQRTAWAVAGGLLLAIAVLRLGAGSPTDRRTLWLLICYFALPVLIIWWSAWERPIFNERYLAVSAPAFALLIAAAFDGRRFSGPREPLLRGAALLLLAALLAGMTLSLYRHYADPAYSKTRGWRDLAAALERFSAGLPAEQVRIAQNFPDPTLWYYYRGAVEHIVLPPGPHDEAGARAAVDALAKAGVRRILLPLQPAANWDDRDLAVAALAQSPYDRVDEERVGVWPLLLYAGQPSPRVEAEMNALFENGFLLHGVSGLEGQQLVPGGLLTFTLVGMRPPGDVGALKLSVQLLNDDGALATQQDLPLTEWRRGDGRTMTRNYGLRLPAELPPGGYRLIAVLYDPTIEGLPRIRTMDGAELVELATFRIEE